MADEHDEEPSRPAERTSVQLADLRNEDGIAGVGSVLDDQEERYAITASEDGVDEDQPLRSSSNIRGTGVPFGSPATSGARPFSYGLSAIGGDGNDRSSNTTSDLSWLPRHSTQSLLTRSADNLGGRNKFSSAFLASNSHIPSLQQRAFLQPMSSQQLQAARGLQTPGASPFRPVDVTRDFDERSFTNRNSTGSALTIKGGHALPSQHDIQALPRAEKGQANGGYDGAQDDDRDDLNVNGFDDENADEHQLFAKPKSDRIYSSQSQERLGVTTPQQQARPITSRSLTSSFRRIGERTSGVLRPPAGHEKISSREPSLLSPHAYQTKANEPTVEEYADMKANAGNNWEYFDGNTVFCWEGRLQNARDKPISIITALLILVPSGLWFGFSAPWLWHHVSPAVPIMYAYLLFICMSSYFHASTTDPGILPRNLHPQPMNDGDPLTLGPPTTEWIVVLSAVAQHGAFEVPTKYCKTCNIWRPPRCHHCRVCDNCVDTQDHHCLWLNNCVGRRNYRHFLAFVASGTFLGIYLWAASLGHLVSWSHTNSASLATSFAHNGVAAFTFVYGLIIFLYPAALWGYHLFLIVRGQTTREYLNSKKFLKKDRHRPFNQKTWWHNLVVVLLRPRPPTNLGFKRRYVEGDQRFGDRRGHRTAPLAKEQQGGSRALEMQHMNGGQQPHVNGNGNANGYIPAGGGVNAE